MPHFKKYYIVNASPQEVYRALTEPTLIRLWSGEPAVMSTLEGSEFSLWGDSITGRNMAFEENKKIVQEWYFGDQEEASVVTIKLHEHKSGTSVELRHENIPDEAYEDICEGWNESYWASVTDFFSEEV